MASTDFHRLKISSISHPTDQSVAIGFDVPAELKQEFSFVPGQYLTLRDTIDGEDVRRSYSICSALEETELRVGIKQVENGAFSNHAAKLQVGSEVLVMSPQGRFTAQIGGTHNYLLVASGSGITPCLSIARSVLEGEPDSHISLLYGNQYTRSIMFLDELIALKDQFTERFQMLHALSREETEISFLNGRLDKRMLKELAARNIIQPGKFDTAYVCGPQAMIESVSETLQELGLAQDQIQFELFGTQTPSRPTNGSASAEKAVGAEVSIILDGTRKAIRVDGSKDTVLKAAQDSGLDLPFSCAGGMCCTCRCKVVDGEAAMDVNYSLQDWEVEAGFVLACQSRPLSKELTLDFDAS